MSIVVITTKFLGRLKANPFIMRADDYHEFEPTRRFLDELLPDCAVTFEEVSNDEIANIDDDVVVGQGPYAAWFKVTDAR